MKNDDKTEKPTAKRKKEAKRDGRVAKSPDVSGWLVVLVSSLLVPTLFHAGATRLEGLFAQVSNVITHPSQAGAVQILGTGLGDVAALLLPALGAVMVVAVSANIAQTGLVLSAKAAAPKWSHLNPLQGVKKLFSVQSLWQLVKQTLKLAVLLAVAYPTLSGLVHQLLGAQSVDMTPMVDLAGGQLIGMIRAVALGGLLLGAADYAVQRHQLQKSLKMTKHEVKEEHRQSEGDPHIRGAVRRKQRTLSRLRMMAAVANADVVITNPTHYAVALRYDPSTGGAPRVVAKGADAVAARIREEAAAHEVPVVEDPPLTRAVYAACDLDDAIPAELYLAVARLLAFVFTLPAVVRRSGIAHHRPQSALLA